MVRTNTCSHTRGGFWSPRRYFLGKASVQVLFKNFPAFACPTILGSLGQRNLAFMTGQATVRHQIPTTNLASKHNWVGTMYICKRQGRASFKVLCYAVSEITRNRLFCRPPLFAALLRFYFVILFAFLFLLRIFPTLSQTSNAVNLHCGATPDSSSCVSRAGKLNEHSLLVRQRLSLGEMKRTVAHCRTEFQY